MDLRPYVAIDTETTGLSDADQILQIGIVVDDLVTPIQDLFKTSFLVDNSERLFTGYLDPIALSMNAWIFDALADKKGKSPYPIYKHPAARITFANILKDVVDKTGRSIVFAGKNVATFDLRMLKNNGFLEDDLLDKQGITVSHRTLDIGSLYFPDFGYVPTANEINEKIGRKPVNHDALSDALDVVCAVRTKMRITV